MSLSSGGANTHSKVADRLGCKLRVWSVALALLTGASPLLNGQTAAPANDKALLKLQLSAREKRADVLLDELRGADTRIEITVDRVVEVLQSVGDSKDSRTKVTRLKEQTIEGLKRNLTYYQQKRAALQEELRRPTLHLSVEEKQRAIAKFDSRIEKRVQQVLALSKSLPTHKDYQRYDVVAGDGYGWRDRTTFVENEDYKQNKRLTTQSNAQREAIIKELKGSIERIDRQTRTLQSQLASAPSEGHRKLLQDEIAKNDALTKTRRAQLAEVVTASETATRPVGNKEAQNLDVALRRTVDSLKPQFTALFQRYSEYLMERSNVNAAKASLEALN